MNTPRFFENRAGLLCAFLLLACLFFSTKQSRAQDPRILQYTLTPNIVHTIPIGDRTATTIYFPKKIRALLGYGLTDGSTPGSYHYEGGVGSKIIALRNLLQGYDCYANILIEDELYTFHLSYSQEPAIAVKFTEFQAPDPSKFGFKKNITKKEILERRPRYDFQILQGVLNKSKNFYLLQKSHPETLQGVTHRRADDTLDLKDVVTRTLEVWKHGQQDAIVLLVEVLNRLDYPISYDPHGLQVRVGSRVYPVTLSEATGKIPAKSSTMIYLLMVGDAEGNREHLALENQFFTLLPQYGKYSPESPQPVSIEEPYGFSDNPHNVLEISK